MGNFFKTIGDYYRHHGRSLPWRRTHDPYKILVSEVMLQQTQVERVVPKYRQFLKKFPNFESVAKAPLAEILKVWQGLGYNRRALYLKRLSKEVADKYHGILPRDPRALQALPGIGKATAGAIAAFAFGIPALFIETNIRRVFIHFFFSSTEGERNSSVARRAKGGWSQDTQVKVSDAEILALVEKTLDRKNPRGWYYALMDYGAMLAKRIGDNPNRKSRHYHTQSRFEGSNRQLRGALVKTLLVKRSLPLKKVHELLSYPSLHIQHALRALEREGFLKEKNGRVALVS